jgi:V8-like Glu-specific endopeptidase
MKVTNLLCLGALLLVGTQVSKEPDINTVLMGSTFKIFGPTTPDPSTREARVTYGTAFLVGRPKKGDPAKSSIVLVTAAHVLDEMIGEQAVLILRKKNGDGTFTKVPYQIKIRNQSTALYVRHRETDVAAMYLTLPEEIARDLLLIPPTLLADDKTFAEFEIHPGDELHCLGYPLGAESNEAGFPILRSGKIASYPITPVSKFREFLYDFKVLPGNSGGPVYFFDTNRYYGNQFHGGQGIRFVAGLVSKLATDRNTGKELDLAVVIHAQYILETINLLPE